MNFLYSQLRRLTFPSRFEEGERVDIGSDEDTSPSDISTKEGVDNPGLSNGEEKLDGSVVPMKDLNGTVYNTSFWVIYYAMIESGNNKIHTENSQNYSLRIFHAVIDCVWQVKKICILGNCLTLPIVISWLGVLLCSLI